MYNVNDSYGSTKSSSTSVTLNGTLVTPAGNIALKGPGK